MKKLVTLFMVVLMAMTLVAAPTTQIKRLSETPVKSVRQEHAVRLIKQDVRKRANKAAVKHNDKSFDKQHAMPMKKAAAATIELNADGFLVGPEYEAATGNGILH